MLIIHLTGVWRWRPRWNGRWHDKSLWYSSVRWLGLQVSLYGRDMADEVALMINNRGRAL